MEKMKNNQFLNEIRNTYSFLTCRQGHLYLSGSDMN